MRCSARKRAMATQHRNHDRRSESGNVFFIIMLGVVLFAALMLTFSRSARQGGDQIGAKQAELLAVDILTYAQGLGTTVNKIMLKDGMSENLLSFENPVEAGYTNAACNATPTPAACKIFDASGGGQRWEGQPPNAGDGSPWTITGQNAVPDIGDDTAADLVLLLPGLKRDLCLTINNKLGLDNPGGSPPTDTDGLSITKFTGAFTNSERLGQDSELSGERSGCILHTQPNPDIYIFYHVLVER